MNSISDTNEYRNICKVAANNLHIFKQLNEYKKILEHSTSELGMKYYKRISEINPELINFKNLHPNDILGLPDLLEDINISPSTLRYLNVLCDLIYHGLLTKEPIIEVGGGYGGQCLVINNYEPVYTYTIIDLFEPVYLTNRYLDYHKLSRRTIVADRINFSDLHERYGLFISNYAFSECDRESQEVYVEIMKRCTHGYITMNFISKFDNIYTIEELLSVISNSFVVDEEPLTYKGNKIIIW